MKLDPRIIEDKRPLTCFDSEYAKQFIGKTGFFTDKLEQFCDLDELPKAELRKVWQNETYCFFTSLTMHKYFLPCEWVKSEKKYRPFTLNEFLVKFPMLTDITMRVKGDNDCIITCAVTAYRTRDIGADICLGVEWISLKELLDKYEYKNTLGDWMPFGEEE